MKSLKVFLGLLIAGALMTACQKEVINELSTEEKFQKELKEDYARYIAEHDNELTIEYATLEEVNKTFTEAGFAPVTLEEIGMTEEEYRLGQERINNPEAAKDRCTAYLAVYYGDMNNSSSLSMFDVMQINAWVTSAPTGIYGPYNTVVTPPGTGYRRFGLFSSEVGVWPTTVNNENLFLTIRDKNIAIKIILGQYTCI